MIHLLINNNLRWIYRLDIKCNKCNKKSAFLLQFLLQLNIDSGYIHDNKNNINNINVINVIKK